MPHDIWPGSMKDQPRVRPLDGRKDCARGNAFVLCPGETKQIVYAQNPNCEAAEPVHVTLSLHTQNEEDSFDPNALVWPRVVADLEWGIGGQNFTAKCDVANGAQFAIVCEMIRVSARYQIDTPPWAPEVLLDPPVYIVSGGLGYCGTRRPTMTELAQIESPGGKALVKVPKYANTFAVLPVNDGKAGIRILGDGGGYGVNARIGVPLSNEDQYNAEDGFTLFNGARYVEVTNNNNTGPLFAFLCFELAI